MMTTNSNSMIRPDTALNRLMDIVVNAVDISLTSYDPAFLRRRIEASMRERNIRTWPEYTTVLGDDRDECHRLIANLSINKTCFFRDPEMWHFWLHRIVPEYLAQPGPAAQRSLRICSAGCATGEEPYTISLIFNEPSNSLRHIDVKIFALDLNEQALRHARRGIYQQKQLTSIPASMASFFHRRDDDCRLLDDSVRNSVYFQKHNLLLQRIPRYCDFVFCRNVMIYFDQSSQTWLRQTLDKSLLPGGYLILGGSELLLGEQMRSFETVSDIHKIYRKRG